MAPERETWKVETVRESDPAEAELRHNFDQMLRSVLGGGGLRSDAGLDMHTEDALSAVARAYPDIPAALVDAARAAFARQLASLADVAQKPAPVPAGDGSRQHGRGGGAEGWAQFGDGLAQELARLPAGALVSIVENRLGAARFAQFVRSDASLSGELVGGEFLDLSLKAGAAGEMAIQALGWHGPDSWHNNWWAELRLPLTPADYRRIAGMVVGGLRDGYGITGPESLTYDAWNERTGNTGSCSHCLGWRGSHARRQISNIVGARQLCDCRW